MSGPLRQGLRRQRAGIMVQPCPTGFPPSAGQLRAALRCAAQKWNFSTMQEMLSLLPRPYASSVSFLAAFSGSCQ